MGVEDIEENYIKMQDLEKLKYPIGEYNYPKKVDKAQIKLWIDSLENFPQQFT